ncbi:hypothetical protein [Streptomyces sp. ME18-1-4]|uniref:hypothetical protein n=1 Tax=Streptomyces sp. ME18-1-4 TaxID=3028685 RepID=UPI0029AF7E0F|nr:hypothetical protein [Streptomyces sp. ME18-1-4]MDX3241578.1 hypothetical protein [Streptomyces sp. ME18-1-4]
MAAVIVSLAGALILVALAARTGLGGKPGRVVAGTVMYAVIYLAIGALIGVLAANPVNGTVLVPWRPLLSANRNKCLHIRARERRRPLPPLSCPPPAVPADSSCAPSDGHDGR